MVEGELLFVAELRELQPEVAAGRRCRKNCLSWTFRLHLEHDGLYNAARPLLVLEKK